MKTTKNDDATGVQLYIKSCAGQEIVAVVFTYLTRPDKKSF
jgi:hypothetical protein